MLQTLFCWQHTALGPVCGCAPATTLTCPTKGPTVSRFASHHTWTLANSGCAIVQLLTKIGILNVPDWFIAGREAQKGAIAPFSKRPLIRPERLV